MIQLAAITIVLYGGWTLVKAYNQYDRWKKSPIDYNQNKIASPCCSSS